MISVNRKWSEAGPQLERLVAEFHLIAPELGHRPFQIALLLSDLVEIASDGLPEYSAKYWALEKEIVGLEQALRSSLGLPEDPEGLKR